MTHFTIIPANDFIWNQEEFIQFLFDHQGRAINISTNNEGVCLKSAGISEFNDSQNKRS